MQRRNLSYYLVLLVALYWQQLIFAQGSKFSTKKFTIANGLPDLYILNLFQDSRGFIWVGTNGGLSRFDGKNFVNYGIRNGLTNPYVNQVVEDRQNRLWVGTRSKLFQFSNNRFVEYPLSDSATFQYTYFTTQLASGKILACTESGSYFFENDEWKKLTLVPGYENKNCLRLLETPSGTLYNLKNILLFIDKNGKRTEIWNGEDDHPNLYFNHIQYFKDVLYVSTYDGIYQYLGKEGFKKLFTDRIEGKRWRNFFIDSKDRCWVHEFGSKQVLISEPGNRQQFSDSIPLIIPLTSGFLQDKDDALWIASGEGLIKVQEQNTSLYSKKENPLIDDIRNITETPEGALVAFSRENGILQFQNKDFVRSGLTLFTDKEPGHKNDFADSYTMDDKNRIWFATREDRLFCLENGRLVNKSDLVGKGNYINWLSYDHTKNRLFLSQETLNIVGPWGNKVFKPANSSAISTPWFVHCFKNGKTLLSSRAEECMMIDEQDSIFKINKILGLPASAIGGSFFETADGNFWLYGNGDGIKYFTWDSRGFPVSEQHITTVDGLPNNMVQDMTMDAQGRLWVGTAAGPAVVIIDKTNNKVNVFPLADQLEINNERPTGLHLTRARDSSIWMSGLNEIYRFYPSLMHFSLTRPGICIEEIRVNLKSTNWKNLTDSFFGYWQMPVDPVLKHNQNTIQFRATGINFHSSAGFLYSYRLEGLDTTWNSTNSDIVLYAKLPPGKYKFSVRGKTPNSEWSEPASFSFSIKPPFWSTTWFRILLLLLAASLILAFYRSRIRKIQQKAFLHNQMIELEMTALKAQMNPHFIYNALNSIQALVVSDKKDDAIYYIGTFARLLRQVLENSDTNLISLQKELQNLELYISLESLRLNMQPQYQIAIAENINTELEKIPPLLLQPFVENSLWHGLSKKEGDKSIRITLEATADWLKCTIEDNGIGRQSAAAARRASTGEHHSKAISITWKRLIDFNADNTVTPLVIEDLQSADGTPTGTRVILTIRRK